mmetsp:Transcript_14462/g.30950  ORF Transcript_14462/g.30950 Transcript_14462/m.30950 type:complete len:1017 (-) Transcript_14462:85-3135(-)
MGGDSIALGGRHGNVGGRSSMFVSAFQSTQFTSPVPLSSAPRSGMPRASAFSSSHNRLPGDPFAFKRTQRHRRTAVDALPTPDDLGLDASSLSSFLISFGDLIHTATTSSLHHDFPSLSNLADAADHVASNFDLHANGNAIQNFNSPPLPGSTLTLSSSSSSSSSATLATAAADAATSHQISVKNIVTKVVDEIGHEIENEMTSSSQHNILVTPEMEKASLDDVGHDLIVFLAVSVAVAPLSSFLRISPVLLYLLFGMAAGPHGFSLLRGSEDVGFELGDFGILFLLFVEGLNLSPERLRELGSFFSLGATQLLLSVGVIFFGFFLGGPLLFQVVSNPNVPIDPLIVQLLEQPVVAFAIAAAGALSSSAFVLPILKEKGWEDRPDGIAALSILLLQDLAVAPLLVILPLIADVEGVGNNSEGGADPIALGILAFKATVGFGAVLALASVVLRKVFQLVASSRSSQSFVAASLLVAVGMGVVSDALGLSSTTGAFAAGVLLAESGYRAQIEADINPFEGILLGVFFVTAGSALDPSVVIQYWPTLLAGISSFLAIKFAVIFAGGGALGLSKGDAARIAILLAGGGEFAFVVFNLASENGIIPDTLGSILTASVIISMALTPLLGEVADFVGKQLDVQDAANEKAQWLNEDDYNFDYDISTQDYRRIADAFQRFDKDGNGEITAEELQNIFTLVGERDRDGAFLTLDQVRTIIRRFDENDDGVLQFEEFAKLWMAKRRSAMSEEALRRAVVVCGYNEVGQQLCSLLDRANIAGIPYVAFARDAESISAGVTNGARVIYGDGASGSLIRAAGVEEPTAIAITYQEVDRCLRATACLRDAFPETPIFVRSDRNDAVKKLIQAGATEVFLTAGSVASGMGKLLGVRKDNRFAALEEDSAAALTLRNSASALYPSVTKESDGPVPDLKMVDISDMDPETARKLYRLFSTSLTLNDEGKVQLSELLNEILRTSDIFIDDDTLGELLGCESLNDKCMIEAQTKFVSFSDFVSLYRKNRVLGKSK